jgi:hypothetical protein
MNFQEIRQKYPDYQDMSDEQFAQKFHQKFYGDMSFEDFSSKVGYSKEPSFLDKAIGVGETGLNLLTAGTTGTLAGAVGGAQGILDSIASGTFGSKEGVKQAEEKFLEQMQMATYEPRTDLGKKYANQAGEFVMQNAPALVAVAPQLEQLSALNALRKSNKAAAQPVPPSAIAAEELIKNRKTQEPTPVEMSRTQAELDLGQPNQFGHRPSEFTIDENGIPIRRNASLEAQETAKQGDLFSLENQAQELRNDVLNRAEPTQEGFPANRDYLKQQETELAYQQKAKQDSLLPEEPVAEPPQRSIGQTGFGRGQRGSIGFFDKDPFEKFSDEIKNKIPDATPEEIKKVWDNQQQLKKQQDVANAVGKINPKLQENLSIYRDIDRPSALQAIASSADSDVSNLGFMRNQVLSRGRLGLEKIKNEGVKSGLAYMIGLHDQGGIKANEILHGPDGILRDLRKQEALFAEGQAGEVLRQRQEAQFNPEYKYNFTPEQAKINDKITKVFDDIRSEMERVTGKTIHEVPNYFPSMFYGPFAVEIRDAGGKLVAFVTEKSAKEARKAASEVVSSLGSEFTVSEPKFRREITSQGFKNRAGLAPYFEAMLDLLSSDDPSVLKAQESVQRVVAKRAMDTQQMQNRMKFKAGVKGAEGEKSWKSPTENYRDAKDVLENYIRGFEEWKANMESAKFVNDVKDLNVPNTYNILQDYFDNLRGVRDSTNKFTRDLEVGLAKSGYDISKLSTTAARKSAGLLTKGWLGFWNPAAMSQNILQPIATFPKLIELATSGGSKDIITPFIIGMAKSLQDGYELVANKTTGKAVGERMKYMRENEVIKPGLVEAENRTKVGHYMEKGLVSGGLLTTEAFARATTFNIFETYLKNSGYSLEEARSLAKNLTHDYQVNYENYAKSGAIANSGIVGELAGRLQSYKINQMTQLANYLMELKQNKNPAPIGAFVMTSIAMAGISGMIGMDVAEGIYGLMVKAGLIDPDTRSPRQMAMDIGGAAATGIPSAATGKWLSGSLTTNLIGDMSWRNLAPIFVGLIDTGSKLPIAGKWAKDVITGEHSLPMSEKAQLLQAVTPTSLRGRWEDRLLTDPEGRVSSPYTGQVSYIKGPQDQDLLSKFTNLRSKERGEAISRQALLKNQEANIKDAIDSRTKKLEKLFDESVRMNKPLDEQVLNREIQRILDLGGDPATTISQINNFIVKNHMGDWFEQQVASGKINLGSVNRKLRAMNEREQLYGR